jgi:hypothetical protein
MLNTIILGARLWIWMLLVVAVLFLAWILLVVFKEFRRKIWYRIRYPQKCIKVVIHFDSGYFNEYYRLIPRYDRFTIEKLDYIFNEKVVKKHNETYLVGKKDDLYAHAGGKRYTIRARNLLKKRFNKTPVIHYFYGEPLPLDLNDLRVKNKRWTSAVINDLTLNDMFAKLLFLKEERNFLVLIVIIVCMNAVLTLLILLKVFGVLDERVAEEVAK